MTANFDLGFSLSQFSDNEMETQLFDDNDDLFDDLTIFDRIIDENVPNNTMNSNKMALETYSRWARSLDRSLPHNKNIPLEYGSLKYDRMNYVLGRFSLEVVDTKGVPYTSTTLYQIISGLNRSLKKRADNDANLDLMQSAMFRKFKEVLDSIVKGKQAIEPANRKRKVDVFTPEDYEKMWLVMDDSDPKILTSTMIFVTMRVFGLRGADELYRFNVNNIKIEDLDDNSCLISYIENSSKNRQPGLKNINVEKKCVQHFEYKSNERGFYYWLKTYLQRCPESVKNGGVFWLHPIKNWNSKQVWYSENRKLGINYFSYSMKSIYEKAGLTGDYTLRSIRSSVVNDLTQNEIDITAIKARTGHKSDRAVAEYKRPKDLMTQKMVSNILSHNCEKSKFGDNYLWKYIKGIDNRDFFVGFICGILFCYLFMKL